MGQTPTVPLGPTPGVPELVGKRPDSARPGGDDGISEAGPWDGESVSECLAAFSRFFNFFRENRLVRMGPSLGQIWNLANLA